MLLLTGFEPNDDGINASEIVVRSLREKPPADFPGFSDTVRCEIMPGNTNTLKAELQRVLFQHNPTICVFTGQAVGRPQITVERLATNLRDFSVPDRAGNLVRAQSIELDGPVAYWATLPGIQKLIDVLVSSGIPASPSNHAGNHLCNQLLYHGLHLAALSTKPTPVGFIHIPALPEQSMSRWSETPSMPLEMSRRAVALLIQTLLEETEANR